jgi:hypothetical protein
MNNKFNKLNKFTKSLEKAKTAQEAGEVVNKTVNRFKLIPVEKRFESNSKIPKEWGVPVQRQCMKVTKPIKKI